MPCGVSPVADLNHVRFFGQIAYSLVVWQVIHANTIGFRRGLSADQKRCKGFVRTSGTRAGPMSRRSAETVGGKPRVPLAWTGRGMHIMRVEGELFA